MVSVNNKFSLCGKSGHSYIRGRKATLNKELSNRTGLTHCRLPYHLIRFLALQPLLEVLFGEAFLQAHFRSFRLNVTVQPLARQKSIMSQASGFEKKQSLQL